MRASVFFSVLLVASMILINGCGTSEQIETITTPNTTLTLDQSQTSIPGNTGLEGDWWLSQGFVPSMPLVTAVEVYMGSVHA